MKIIIGFLMCSSFYYSRAQVTTNDSSQVKLEQYFNTSISDSLRNVYKAKIDHISKYLIKDSLNPQAFLERGMCFTILGLHNKSIIDYNKTIQLDSTNGVAYFNRGLAKARFIYSIEACRDLKLAYDYGVDNAQVILIQQCSRFLQKLNKKK